MEREANMMSRNSMKKSGTFALKRYPSNAALEPPPPGSSVPPQPNQLQQQGSEEEILFHYTHSHHPLAHVALPEPFTCTGCKERGAGKRFACQKCDFQLHDFCAISPPLLKAHPLHGQHQLLLHSKPKTGGILWPRCDVCGKATKGFTYRCGACNFQMHPCCAMLSNQINFSSLHPHSLKLLPPLMTSSSSGDPPAFTCGECKRKRSGRVYRCTCTTDCDYYYVHAVCAKNIINGLKDTGINTSNPKPSMVGPAARLASQVVIDFIGGLFEGFGEAVGQALIQNIAGRRRGRNI